MLLRTIDPAPAGGVSLAPPTLDEEPAEATAEADRQIALLMAAKAAERDEEHARALEAVSILGLNPVPSLSKSQQKAVAVPLSASQSGLVSAVGNSRSKPGTSSATERPHQPWRETKSRGAAPKPFTPAAASSSSMDVAPPPLAMAPPPTAQGPPPMVQAPPPTAELLSRHAPSRYPPAVEFVEPTRPTETRESGVSSWAASSLLSTFPYAAALPDRSSARSLNLVHLAALPPRLASPELRPSTVLGAACGPAGLGPHGDAELGDEEEEELQRQLENERKTPLYWSSGGGLGRSATAPPPRGLGSQSPLPTLVPPPTADASGGGAPASPDAGGLKGKKKTAKDGGAQLSLLQGSRSSQLLRMPTPLDLRKSASLGCLVPPEPTPDLLRAGAYEQRKSRGAPRRLTPAPSRFSSIASRNRSPLEFLASITDWDRPPSPAPSRPVVTPHTAFPPPPPRHSASAASLGTGRMTPYTDSMASLAQSRSITQQSARRPLLPSNAANTHRRPPSLAGLGPSLSATALLEHLAPPKRAPTREWVAVQAGLNAAKVVVPEARTRDGMPVLTPAEEPAGIFVKARPSPAPPPRVSPGAPWMQSARHRGQAAMAF